MNPVGRLIYYKKTMRIFLLWALLVSGFGNVSMQYQTARSISDEMLKLRLCPCNLYNYEADSNPSSVPFRRELAKCIVSTTSMRLRGGAHEIFRTRDQKFPALNPDHPPLECNFIFSAFDESNICRQLLPPPIPPQ